MAEISKIKFPSGNTYDIKDATAREAIASLSGGTKFLGETTTPLTDQATTNPITIDGSSITATNGNIVVYLSGEFIFNGTKWIKFGDLSNLGTLATKNSVTLSKGSGKEVLGRDTTFNVTQPTVTVTPSTSNVPNVTSAGNASTWNFAMGTGNEAETLVISGANGTAPTLGTDIAVVTGISSATASGAAVSANTNDTVEVAEYDDLSVSVS